MNAINNLLRAIAESPNDPALHYNLGGVYLGLMQLDKAMESYARALALAPQHPQILLQLGNTASAGLQHKLAIQYFKQCLEVSPQNASAYFNLGNSYREIHLLKEAVKSFKKCISITPHDADAHNNLGNVYRELGQLDLAITCYQMALKINPALHHALAHLIHQKQHVCDWTELDHLIQQLRHIATTYPDAQIPPFAFLAMPGTTMQEQMICADHWAMQQFNAITQANPPFVFARPLSRRIKIGYLSADFRMHPLAYLITDLLKHHDRRTFEIYALSYGPDDASHARSLIQEAVDVFIDLRQMHDKEAADYIHAQEIDILVDLTGYTQSSRTSIAALRPTPITINWLGFPGTMGQINQRALFDYILVDENIAPKADDFRESCLYLPCYQPNNTERPANDSKNREAYGLPEDNFVFCCFNQSFKITPDVFATWMEIMRSVPNSVMWLLDCNPWATLNLKSAARNHGIAENRLIFAPRCSIQDHLARHRYADLFLDTLPYNAHTTASDALWMDVPLLTCKGATFASRVSASLLSVLGLEELITENHEQYKTCAIALASDPNRINTLRQKIQTRKHALFDSKQFALTLEKTYKRIYDAWHKNNINQ